MAHDIAATWVKDQKQQWPICSDMSHLDHSILQACSDTKLRLSTQYQLRPFNQWNPADHTHVLQDMVMSLLQSVLSECCKTTQRGCCLEVNKTHLAYNVQQDSAYTCVL